jgi:hypothetical protein
LGCVSEWDVWGRTEAAGVQRPHVEDVDSLHLSEDLETLKTGGLLGIGRNGTGLRTRGEKVGLVLDLYNNDRVSNSPSISYPQ